MSYQKDENGDENDCLHFSNNRAIQHVPSLRIGDAHLDGWL